MNTENETRIEIDGVTYVVSTHYADSEETVIDKIARLVQGDENFPESSAI